VISVKKPVSNRHSRLTLNYIKKSGVHGNLCSECSKELSLIVRRCAPYETAVYSLGLHCSLQFVTISMNFKQIPNGMSHGMWDLRF